MRIVFLGLPLAALLLIGDGHQVVLAGVRPTLSNGTRRLRKLGTPVITDPQNDWEAFRARARTAGAELLVSWFFTRRIPMGLVEDCPLGGIGVHPSLLPRHRGPDPFFAAIDAGDAETGVTVHRIAADYDTGAIVAQRSIRIDPRWNAWQLARQLDRPSLALLRETVQRAARGDDLRGQPQEERKATLAPSPAEDDRELRWSWPAERLERRIRALAPVPGALALVGDTCMMVLRARPTDDVPRALEPGEAAILDTTVVVRAGDRGLVLEQVEIDGKTYEGAELATLVARASKK